MKWPIFNYGEPTTWWGKAFDQDPVAAWLIICFILLVLIVLGVSVTAIVALYFTDPPTAAAGVCP